MKSIFSKLSVITTLFIPAIANAHPGHDSTAFTSGLTHPFTGLDHLIMLFAFGLLVGCLSTSQSRKLGLIALSLLTLLGGLVAGQWFGVMNGVEEAIVASLFVVSIAISLAFSQSQNVLKLAVVSCVAMMFFHGYAHGVEASGKRINLIPVETARLEHELAGHDKKHKEMSMQTTNGSLASK